MRILTVCVFSWLVLLPVIAVSGCKQGRTNSSGHGPAGRDPNAGVATFLATWCGPDTATEQRTRLALSKWQNGILDHEPILLTTTLSKPSRARPSDMILVAFDEDKDLLGFGVLEKYSDGTQRSEEYPVYVHLQQMGVIDTRAVPVQIRDKGQQKDESRWEEYVRGEKIDKWSLKHVHNYYSDTIPAVNVSIPDPNRVDVFIYLYDRAGNKSPLVELINHLTWREGLRGE
jgi:hypothetical protein